MSFQVRSEVGQLRQVIVHRPGLELSRLTPRNIGELLFDDVLWAKRAKEEHDAFAQALRDKGVRVHYFGQLLGETLDLPEGRAFVLDRLCTPEQLGPALVGPLRQLFGDMDGSALAEMLVGGVLKADLHPVRARGSLRWNLMSADDFLLPPLPNHLFQRDNSCWIYGGVSVNPMAKAARQRETLHSRAIYRYHPMFASAGFVTYYGDDDTGHQPATVEGGDVHVLGNGAVLVGMGERTTPMAVELLAQALFRSGQDRDRCRTARDQGHDAPGHRDDHGGPPHLRPLPLPRPAPALLDPDARGRRGGPGHNPQQEPVGHGGPGARGGAGYRAHHRRGHQGRGARAMG
jgi:arginine deiminase